MNYWKYSRVVKPRAGDDHCIVASAEPPLLCAGDYFDGDAVESTVGSCMKSARAAVAALLPVLHRAVGDSPLASKNSTQCLPLPRPLPERGSSLMLESKAAPPPELSAQIGESAQHCISAQGGERGQRRVLVVGAGLSGSMVVHALRKSHPSLSVRPDRNPSLDLMWN